MSQGCHLLSYSVVVSVIRRDTALLILLTMLVLPILLILRRHDSCKIHPASRHIFSNSANLAGMFSQIRGRSATVCGEQLFLHWFEFRHVGTFHIAAEPSRIIMKSTVDSINFSVPIKLET